MVSWPFLSFMSSVILTSSHTEANHFFYRPLKRCHSIGDGRSFNLEIFSSPPFFPDTRSGKWASSLSSFLGMAIRTAMARGFFSEFHACPILGHNEISRYFTIDITKCRVLHALQNRYYSHRGNTRAKAGWATVHSLRPQRVPGEYIAFSRAFLPYFRVATHLFSQFQQSLRS